MQSEFENLLLDTQKEYSRSNRMKDKIIIVLIVFMFFEAVIGYCGFVWYESQFDYVTTEQTTKVKVTKVRTTTTAKVGKSRNKSGGSPNKCPICGKFMGNGSHGQT